MTLHHPSAIGQPAARASLDRERSVVLTGTFDVHNYGDLLFPLIAARKLRPWGFDIRPASPTGRPADWRDAMPPEPLIEALFGEGPLDGILIGGGNIIHAQPVTLPDYATGSMADWAYGSLWLGATLAGAIRNVPVAWNAPGIPQPFHDDERVAVNLAVAAAGYVSVRDETSAALLAPFPASVVPDTALDLAELWPINELEHDFRAMLARNQADPANRYLAVHVKERSVHGPVEVLAPAIDAICAQTGRVPILIGIGRCHGDDVVGARLAAALAGPHIDLSKPMTLREIAAAIAFSDGYVGASMHGFVTAAAYGRPGIIVGRPNLPKMRGLLHHLDRLADEAPDWQTALSLIAPRLGSAAPRIPGSVRASLDEHWRKIGLVLASEPANLAAQTEFLRHSLSSCFARKGWFRTLPDFTPKYPDKAS